MTSGPLCFTQFYCAICGGPFKDGPHNFLARPDEQAYTEVDEAMFNGTGGLNAIIATYNSIGMAPDPDAGPQCDFWKSSNAASRN